MNLNKKMSIGLLALIALVIAGCSNPQIVQTAPDTYMLTRQDRGGIFGNSSKMEADVVSDANEFAKKQGKVAVRVSSESSPMWPGHFASFTYNFRLVDPNDPSAKNPPIDPKLVVEKNDGKSAVSPSPQRQDIYEQLTKLDDLRKKGILSQAEFDERKKKILSAP